MNPTPFSPHDPSDEVLMARVTSGDEGAFRLLINRYEEVLGRLFVRLGAGRDEALDAGQETFLRLYKARNRYQPTGSFRTLLFTIARRAWLDLCRRRERRRAREIEGFDMDGLERATTVDPGDAMDLERALAALPEGQREVLVLSLWGGLRYEEIAQVLSIPEGTVKSRVFHGLKRLRAFLGVKV